MNIGDKIKCIGKDIELTVGKIYTVIPSNQYWDKDDTVVMVLSDKGNPNPYYKRDFVLVDVPPEITLSTIKEEIAKAKSLIGKKMKTQASGNVKITSYQVYLDEKEAYNSSITVCDEFEKSGFVVALRGSGCSIPLNSAEIVSDKVTIFLTEDFDAEISKKGVQVGCQFIPLEKIEEIQKVINELKD